MNPFTLDGLTIKIKNNKLFIIDEETGLQRIGIIQFCESIENTPCKLPLIYGAYDTLCSAHQD